MGTCCGILTYGLHSDHFAAGTLREPYHREGSASGEELVFLQFSSFSQSYLTFLSRRTSGIGSAEARICPALPEEVIAAKISTLQTTVF